MLRNRLATRLPLPRPLGQLLKTEGASPADPRPAATTPALPPIYAAARAEIGRRAWRPAQRLLDRSVQVESDPAARSDLASVRTVRRMLDRLATWPSNPDAHLALGVAYFELELGDDALGEFLRVQRLAPRRYEGFALAALEYLYRKDYPRALLAWEQARDRKPDLGPFEEAFPLDHLGGEPIPEEGFGERAAG